MNNKHRQARVNVKVILILLGVVILLGVSLIVARHVQRRVGSARALTAGKAAYDQGDWKAAFSQYADYVRRNPDDIEILRRYAHAGVSIRPVEGRTLQQAIAACRRLIELDPSEEAAYKELAEVYGYIRNFVGLAEIAQKKLAHNPADRKAVLWLADGLAGQDKIQEAIQLLQPFLEKLASETTTQEEYVQGCIKMSQLVQVAGASDTPGSPLEWLNRAAAYDPDSPEALLLLARHYRMALAGGDDSETILTDQVKPRLEAIATLDSVPPLIQLAASAEWMALGEYEQASAALEKAEKFPQAVLEETIFDLNGWLIGKYQVASELALRQGNSDQALLLTDGILTDIEETRFRYTALPMAVNTYLAAGSVDQARGTLDEYSELIGQQESAPEDSKLTFLKALVAEAEGKPGVVIDTLLGTTLDSTKQPQYWRLLAAAYYRLGKVEPAITAMENYLTFFPNDVTITTQLARTHFTRRAWQQAASLAGHAESLTPNNPDIAALRMEAEINTTLGQTSGTRDETLQRLSDELDWWIQGQPENINMRILQARIAQLREELDQAEEILLGAIEVDPSSLGAGMQLAKIYVATERPEKAHEILQDACKRHAASAEPWLTLALLQESRQDPQAALASLREGLAAVPDDAQKRSLSLKIAALELASGDTRDRSIGLDVLKDLAAQNEQDIQARARLLETQEIRGDPEAARQLIQELRRAEGDSGLRWRYHQAVLRLAQDDWQTHGEEIENQLQYCIDSNTGWALPRLALIAFYQRTKDYARIEDLCRRILATNPQARDVTEQMVMALEQQGRFTEAEKVVQKRAREDNFSRNWQIRTALREGDLTQAIDELKRKAAGDLQDINTRILLARLIYRQDGDAEQALTLLQEADAVTPQTIDVVAARAAILMAEGRFEALQQVLDTHVEEVGDFASYLLRGAYTVEMGRPQDAATDYEKLLTFNERGTHPYVLVADYYQKTNNPDEAIRTVKNGLDTAPEDSPLRRRLLQALYQRGSSQDGEEAEALLSTLQRESPEDTELMQIRVRQRLQAGRPREAQALLEKIIKLDPTDVDSHIMLISLDLQRKMRYEATRQHALRALEANPDHPALLAMQARVELELGKKPAAAAYLAETALQQNPRQAQVLGTLISIAAACENMSLTKDIQTMLAAHIQKEPDREDFRLLKSRTLLLQGQTDRALTELEAYCASDAGQQSFAAQLALVNLYLNQGKLEEGEQRIERAAALDPNSPALLQARISWATSLAQSGQHERAVTVFQALLAEAPDNILLLNNYAWVLQGNFQRYEEALALTNHGLKLYPDFANLLDTRATILAQMEGRLDDAKADFTQLIEIASKAGDRPRQIRSLLKLGRLCLKLNEVDQARQHLQRAQTLDRYTPVLTEKEREEITALLEK